MFALPKLMIAPNGARRTQADHPAIPVSIADIVQCAVDCYAAGADGIHAHIRDAAGRHLLDAGVYRELQQELAARVPGMRVQVTSEAAGRYQISEQQAVIRALKPAYASVALREMLPDQTAATHQQAERFYHWAASEGVRFQHILYSADDLRDWLACIEAGLIPVEDQPHLLFVLGRYARDLQSTPANLQPFLQVLDDSGQRDEVDWAVCAFGVRETACLVAAVQAGGKVRVGFENSLWQPDGSVARDNRERVEQVMTALGWS